VPVLGGFRQVPKTPAGLLRRSASDTDRPGGQANGVPPLAASTTLPVGASVDRDVRHGRVDGVARGTGGESPELCCDRRQFGLTTGETKNLKPCITSCDARSQYPRLIPET
jgi:hypothetical protein